MLRGVLAIRGQAAARGYGFIAVEERQDDVFVLSSEVTDEHGGPAARGEWSALDGRAVEIGDVITTDRGDQATGVRLLPVEDASTDGAEAWTDGADVGAPEDAANEKPWAAGIRAHLERRGWTQGELASRSSLKPSTVGAVLRGDATSTPILTAIAAGFGVEVAALFNGGAPEPADSWTAALDHLEAARRTLAAANVDAARRPELTADAAADVERAALAAHRALEAIGEAAVEARIGRALSAFVRDAEPRNPDMDIDEKGSEN